MEEKKENLQESEIQSVSINEAKDKISNDNQTEIIEQLNSKIVELNDKYLRTAAELENTRRRSALDIESVSRNRAMSVAEKILPVMDAVQSALKHSPDDAGIKSMEKALQNAFAQIGITKIESVAEIIVLLKKTIFHFFFPLLNQLKQ